MTDSSESNNDFFLDELNFNDFSNEDSQLLYECLNSPNAHNLNYDDFSEEDWQSLNEWFNSLNSSNVNLDLDELSDEDNQSFYDCLNPLTSSDTNSSIDELAPNSASITIFSAHLEKKKFSNALSFLNTYPELLPQIIESLVFINNSIPFFFVLFKKNQQALTKTILLNESFASYLQGKPINIILSNHQGDLEEQIRQLSTEELITYFNTALRINYRAVIHELWNNTILASYLSGYPTIIFVRNEEGHLVEQSAQLSDEKLLTHFKRILTSRCSEVIHAVWGKPGSPLQNTINAINHPDTQIELIKKALASTKGDGTSKFLRSFLSSIPNKAILQDLLEERQSQKLTVYNQKRINTLTKALREQPFTPPSTLMNKKTKNKINAKNNLAPFSQYLKNKQFTEALLLLNTYPKLLTKIIKKLPSFRNNIEFFVFLLKEKSDLIISKILKNKTLKSYLSGDPIKIMVGNPEGNLEEQTLQLSTKKVINLFKEVLTSGHSGAIKVLWKNKILALYFCGYPIKTLVRNQEGKIDEQTKQLSTEELITFFQDVLESGFSMIIHEIWGEINSPLQNALHTINDRPRLSELTEKILSSNHSDFFIKHFLCTLPHELLISCMNKVSSYPEQNRIILSEALAKQIDSSSSKNEENILEEEEGCIDQMLESSSSTDLPSAASFDCDVMINDENNNILNLDDFSNEAEQTSNECFNSADSLDTTSSIDELVTNTASFSSAKRKNTQTDENYLDTMDESFSSDLHTAINLNDDLGINDEFTTRKRQKTDEPNTNLNLTDCTEGQASNPDTRTIFSNYLKNKKFNEAFSYIDTHRELLTQITPDLVFIKMKNGILFFIFLLSKKGNSEVTRILSFKSLIIPYLRGDEIKIMWKNQEGCIEEQIKQLNSEELLLYFQVILSSHHSRFIDTVWAKIDSPLRNAVKIITNPQLQIELTKKALLAIRSGSNSFLRSFLSLIPKAILQNCLEENQKQVLTPPHTSSVSPVFEKPAGTSKSPAGTKTGDKYASGGPGRPGPP